jgi:DNA-binding Lrp family transcriptional regulator
MQAAQCRFDKENFMAQKPLSREQLQQAVDSYATLHDTHKVAEALGVSENTATRRLAMARRAGIRASKGVVDRKEFPLAAQAIIRELELSIKLSKETTLDDEYIKSKIIKLRDGVTEPPKWLVQPAGLKSPGIPTLFISDVHHGEVVDPGQINGVNRYNVTIAHERFRTLVNKTITLCHEHLKFPKYPGIVVALGGDMVSGDIHEELVATNQKEIMAVVLDLFGVLVWTIESLRNAFGNVFVPCVSGNHGRATTKIRAKGRNFTSFDWLLYQFLAKHFENDKHVQFLIPDGPDALYSVYGHRYLLTHGDQFRGGDGVIGALGPIIRGDHKKRSRNGQIGMGYDTMLLGHWHQLIQLERLIVNGSLKGYDEYAYSNNFGFEPPRQALWITHAGHGITFSMAVNVASDSQAPTTKPDGEWVSWAK